MCLHVAMPGLLLAQHVTAKWPPWPSQALLWLLSLSPMTLSQLLQVLPECSHLGAARLGPQFGQPLIAQLLQLLLSLLTLQSLLLLVLYGSVCLRVAKPGLLLGQPWMERLLLQPPFLLLQVLCW